MDTCYDETKKVKGEQNIPKQPMNSNIPNWSAATNKLSTKMHVTLQPIN